MLNKKGSRQCPKIVVQNKETSTAPLECSLALRMVAAETRGRVAAQQASGSLPLGGPEKFTRADAPWHAFPILVPSFLQEFDVANAKGGAEQNTPKTEVIY